MVACHTLSIAAPENGWSQQEAETCEQIFAAFVGKEQAVQIYRDLRDEGNSGKGNPNCLGFNPVKREAFGGMPHGLATFLQVMVSSVIGGGVGAGIITFGLNFWKGERDLRRANLERLYTAVHKYTLAELLRARRNSLDPSEDQTELTAQADLISVLIGLYFPQLKPSLESFKNKSETFINNKRFKTSKH